MLNNAYITDADECTPEMLQDIYMNMEITFSGDREVPGFSKVKKASVGFK